MVELHITQPARGHYERLITESVMRELREQDFGGETVWSEFPTTSAVSTTSCMAGLVLLLLQHPAPGGTLCFLGLALLAALHLDLPGRCVGGDAVYAPVAQTLHRAAYPAHCQPRSDAGERAIQPVPSGIAGDDESL